MIRIHSILKRFVAVATKRQGDGQWMAYLDGLAHRAFVRGPSEQEAIDNLARDVAANEAEVLRSARVLGVLL